MSITVRIPAPLRRLSEGQPTVDLTGRNLGDCIDNLDSRFPGFKERLCDESGDLRRFVNIYVNGEDVRFLQGLATQLEDGDEVSIVPAVAGGDISS
ncbi:MAG: molybdopterin synthase sulfur carrier subunit [Chloroflexi bacterium RBG_13_54_9]|nr:MAG: molybdopterin synthase sulfur carrier subunit [Chloroflexi bacterium RBG_13_54_9]